MVYKHAVIDVFLIYAHRCEDAAKRGGCALNSHGNYILDHGNSWKNHGIVFLKFCGNLDMYFSLIPVYPSLFLVSKYT